MNKRKTIINFLAIASFVFLGQTSALAADEIPEALFDVDVVGGIAPYEASFIYIGDASQINSFSWDFGDGGSSTERDPVHTYANANVVRPRVTLVVTNELGSSSTYVDMRVYPEGFVPSETTYYIDSVLGDDSNDGLSQDYPKKDLNSISHPNVGDSVLFKRGSVFEDDDFGASLYLRETGIEGYPVTYGAYGDLSDPRPKIKRQAALPGWDSSENWTHIDFVDANTFDFGARVSSVDRGPLNSRSFIPSNYFSQDGTKFKVTVGGNYYEPVEIGSVYIGEQATSGDVYDMEPGTISQLTFGGSNSVTVYGGGSEESDWLDYNFNHSKTYIISLGISGAPVGMYATGEYHENSYYKAGTGRDGDAGLANVSDDYGALSAFWNIVGYAIDNPGETSNVWYISSTNDPERLWVSGVEAAVVENQGRLSNQYRWMHRYYPEGSLLYIYSEGNPATTYSSIVMAGRYGGPISVINKDYMIFRDLDLQGGYGTGLPMDGVKNILVENCNIGKDSGTHGFVVGSSSSGRLSNKGIIRNSNIDADNHVHNYWHAETTDDGLYISDGASNWTAYNNYVAGWAHTGIVIGTLSDIFQTSNNDVYNNFVTCPDVEYGRGAAFYGEAGMYENNKFHHNIIKDTKVRSQIQAHGIEFYNNVIDGVESQIRADAMQGLMIYRTEIEDTSSIKVYNNVFANTGGAGIELSANSSNGDYFGNIISNNIFYNTGEDEYSVYNNGGAVHATGLQLIIANSDMTMHDNFYQSNIFYKTSGDNFINYGGDPDNDFLKTISEFSSMDGTQGDVITGNTDDNPLFIDPTDPLGPDGEIFTADDGFRLDVGSPAIDAGVDVGLSYFGNAPDIGAYEYELIIRGDVDNSSVKNTTDALLTLRNSLGLSMTATAWQTSATTGDVDCNGVSNSTDALLILRYSLGLDMGETAWCEGD